MLAFFGDDCAAAWSFHDQPRMINVDAERFAVPGDAFIRHEFLYGGIDADAEGLPLKPRAEREVWWIAADEAHVGGIDVPRRPILRADQPRPNDLRCRSDVDFVTHMNGGVTGVVVLGPTDFACIAHWFAFSSTRNFLDTRNLRFWQVTELNANYYLVMSARTPIVIPVKAENPQGECKSRRILLVEAKWIPAFAGMTPEGKWEFTGLPLILPPAVTI